MISLNLSCGGCDAKLANAGHLENRFHSFSGRGHGFGVRRVEVVWRDTGGWCLFDPWTQATYCPECARELGCHPEQLADEEVAP